MQVDLTKGKEWRLVFNFALPLMGALVIQTTYMMIDAIIVGRFVSATALGAIGISNPVVWLLNLVSTSFGAGSSIIISQYVGANKHADVKTIFATALKFCMLLALGLSVVVLLFSRLLFEDFFGTPPEMLADSLIYFRVYVLAMSGQMLYNIVYGALRAHGDSKGAVIFLLISAVLNVGLDLLFVLVFDWAVAGAAWATAISIFGSGIAASIYLWKNHPQLRLSRAEFIIKKNYIKSIWRLTAPILLQSSTMAIGFIVLQRLVNSFGAPSIEGYAAMQRMDALIYIPSNAFNTAMANFAGQNIGAGRVDRVKNAYNQTLILGCIFCFIMIAITYLIGDEALGIFNLTGDAFIRGREHLNILLMFIVFSTINNITAGLLQGVGDVKAPAIASFVNLSIRVISAYIMAETFIDFRSVYYSLPLAWVTGCAITQWRYRSGKWLNKGMVKIEE